jgi:hypothetical protein
MASEFEIYDDAAEKVTNTPECRSWLERIAGDGASYAQGIAPVRTGAYADSITSGVMQGEAPEAYVAAGTDYWKWLEYGTIHNMPYRTLTQTMEYMCNSSEEAVAGETSDLLAS